MSGDEAAAVLDEGAELIALRVAEGGDVGEDEGFVRGEMRRRRGCRSCTISKGMRDSMRAWYQPRAWSSTLVWRVVAAVVQGGLLGVDEGDAGERLLVGEVVLVLLRSRDRFPRRR